MLSRLLALALVALLAACRPSAAPFNNVDITGASYAREFSLTDHTGAKRTLADYRGKVVVVFFGFTHCPDVCPTTMADMAQVKRQLGKDGDRLQVIFVTVDPERDTPAVLGQYVPSFDPTFVGLTGTPDEIARTAKEFKVFYQKVPGKTPTSYSVDHTAGSFAFDTEGRVRLFLKHGQGVEPIVADLKRLLG
ncbi:MAG TPA: SCO family protein [Burkholderiaceae bacterium]|jgi:protein SCO1/2|nr:SCO family protein [Burkholderiaceae bacterium]